MSTERFIADAQRAHVELAELRKKLSAASRILRGDAERAGRGDLEAGVAAGKLRGAEWIDAILRGDFDAGQEAP